MIIEEHSSMAITEQQKIAKSVEYDILKIESLRSLILAIVIGSIQRKECAIIGDVVNFGSRNHRVESHL
ncbi:MAG: hypothetical protein CK551_04625 [Planctomycetaceae bacterium]|nr:hypothetical protein [Gemmataceae bacterium]PHX63715.1 MAG: hypothetical protein CK551_04625 [Planctomycetaceae bacterium]